jgi:hypothetical protein
MVSVPATSDGMRTVSVESPNWAVTHDSTKNSGGVSSITYCPVPMRSSSSTTKSITSPGPSAIVAEA